MCTVTRSFEEMTVEDLRRYPVWEFYSDEEDQRVRPVEALPVKDLSCRILGTEVVLNNGSRVWAVLSNIELNNRLSTRHFITISLERDGKWFCLARYMDSGRTRFGPSQLADFLGLTVGEVFPIRYDISTVAIGDPVCTQGSIPVEPTEKLADSELTILAVRGRLD